jgi:type I site-specific restriction-modification system R (restriction) subunit
MSEHALVEKPFLDQLASLDWTVIDQGPGVPTDPAKSLRSSFREVILEGVFRHSLNDINRTEQGQPWLTDKQISDLIEEILNQPAKSLVEANEAVLKLLYRAQVDVNEVTGEQYPKHHNLLQTIARVNRVAKGKTRGYIVDYIGLTDHLKEALSIYAADDQEDLKEGMKDITSEIPVLEAQVAFQMMLKVVLDRFL